MKRRKFLKSTLYSALVSQIPILYGCQKNSILDHFGGYTKIKGKKTGFFHLENINDRWWFTTPEGNAFLSLGLNHIEPGVLLYKENKAHWLKKFELGEDYSKEEFNARFQGKVKDDLGLYGFNLLGGHSSSRYYQSSFIPYIERIPFSNICHWQTPEASDFPDVFSSDFREHCDYLAKKTVKPYDPYLLGYYFIDCPILTEIESAARGVVTYGAPRRATPTWPRVLRNLGPENPGKQAYVDHIAETHGHIEGFNSVYQTDFRSFDELLNATNWRELADPQNKKEQEDIFNFLLKVVDKYYQVTVSAVKKHDPNHLVLGDKLNGNTDTPSEIVKISSKYTDVVFFQMYGHYADQKPFMDRCSMAGNKPIYNGDGSFSTPSDMLPQPNGPHSKTQEDRAAAISSFATQAFSRSDFVGWDNCGWIDLWKTFPGKKDRQHGGLQDPFGNHYQPMIDVFSKLSMEKYLIASGNQIAMGSTIFPVAFQMVLRMLKKTMD